MQKQVIIDSAACKEETLIPDCCMADVCATLMDGECPMVKKFQSNPDDYELVEEEATLEFGFEDDDDDPCDGCEFEFNCGADNPCPF